MRSYRATHIALGAVLAALPFMIGCYVNTNTGGCSSGDYRAKAERTEDLTTPAGDIAGINIAIDVGAIHLKAADTDEVRVAAEITVKAKTVEEAEDLVERMHVRTRRSGRNLVIEAVKPSDFGRNQLAVNFTITAPRDLALQCTTDVGDIRITDFTRRIEARTDVGKILCTALRDEADLHANVGDIRATYAGDAPARLSVAATTNVGNIDFTGPSEISARLSASTNVGSINTDRPLTVSGHVKNAINATLGQAQGNITLKTNVGSISIR